MRWPYFPVLPRRRQAGNEVRDGWCARHHLLTHAVGRQVAQRLLSKPNLLQQPHGVEAHELSPQPLSDRRPHAVVGQQPITRRRRREVDLVHARAVARLGLQLERGLEEVDIQA